MRKVSGLQVVVFLLLLSCAAVVGVTAGVLLGSLLPAPAYQPIVTVVLAAVSGYLALMVIFRLFCRLCPLPEGDIPKGSGAEFRYHVYLLFFLIAFYPVMFSMILPVPLMRLFYQILGARLGDNTYPGGILMDPPFQHLGSNTIVGQGALIVPHVIEGERLAHHPVRIGSNVTIGARSVILAGCVIEDGATVAIGAVLAKGSHVRAGEVWGGVPARCLRAAAV